MEERTFCPNCGRRNYYDPIFGEYMCTSIPCSKNYPKEIFEELMRMKSDGLDISFCANPKFSSSHLYMIKGLLLSEIEDGLNPGERVKFINNPDFTNEQQNIIWIGLYFERCFKLVPGTIVKGYSNLKYSSKEMNSIFRNLYFKYSGLNTLGLTEDDYVGVDIQGNIEQSDNIDKSQEPKANILGLNANE